MGMSSAACHYELERRKQDDCNVTSLCSHRVVTPWSTKWLLQLLGLVESLPRTYHSWDSSPLKSALVIHCRCFCCLPLLLAELSFRPFLGKTLKSRNGANWMCYIFILSFICFFFVFLVCLLFILWRATYILVELLPLSWFKWQRETRSDVSCFSPSTIKVY